MVEGVAGNAPRRRLAGRSLPGANDTRRGCGGGGEGGGGEAAPARQNSEHKVQRPPSPVVATARQSHRSHTQPMRPGGEATAQASGAAGTAAPTRANDRHLKQSDTHSPSASRMQEGQLSSWSPALPPPASPSASSPSRLAASAAEGAEGERCAGRRGRALVGVWSGAVRTRCVSASREAREGHRSGVDGAVAKAVGGVPRGGLGTTTSGGGGVAAKA